MSPIGLMILIHPAALCLVIGTSLALTGLTWLLLLRRLAPAHPVRTCAILFVATAAIYTAVIDLGYGMPTVRFEMIRGFD